MRRGYEPKITSPTESNFAIGDNEDDDSIIDMRQTRVQSSHIPEYYYEPSDQPELHAPIPRQPNRGLTFDTSSHDLPRIIGDTTTIHPSPSIESFQQVSRGEDSRYPELYTAATGLGLGLPGQQQEPDSSSNYLSVQEPAYALQQRQGYRAGSPVVPILEKFDGQNPFEPPETQRYDNYKGSSDGHSGYGSRAASVRSGRQGSTFTARSQASREANERMLVKSKQQKKRRLIVIGVVVTVVLLAMIIPVAYVTSQKSSDPEPTATRRATRPNATTTTNTTADAGELARYYADDSLWNPLAASTATGVQEGGNGTTVSTFVNGSTIEFTYTNEFGGSFYFDPSNPFAKGGKAQSWTPAIGEEWQWGTDLVKGVNLGGWLVLEPFIAPAMFQGPWAGTLNERELHAKMREVSNVTLEINMREHYETFITEQDFAEIAGAGLNYVRIPLGFWAVGTLETEPFLEGVSWDYFVRAAGWARKYGIRILLDLHALPGSQNRWNHAMSSGAVNWLYGVMGIANAQRSLEVIRSVTEFASQEEYKDVITMVSLVNEVEGAVLGFNTLLAFYYEAYNMIRRITGVGKGQGPIVVIHEGFRGIAAFNGFMPGADRLAIDRVYLTEHPYRAFIDPAEMNIAWEEQYKVVCGWGGGTNESQTNFGIVLGGEFSAAINDCGMWLTGVGGTATYESTGSSCVSWNDWRTWTPELKSNINKFVLAEMDALQNFMFWTWKVGTPRTQDYPSSPFWHYKLGREQGWIPSDPRAHVGMCASVGVGGDKFEGVHPSSATGGGDGVIQTASIGNYSAWPPPALGPSPSFDAAQIAFLPVFTQTGPAKTLSQPSQTVGVAVGNGWANANDADGAWAPIQGCPYPDSFNATAAAVPTAVCTGQPARRNLNRTWPQPTQHP